MMSNFHLADNMRLSYRKMRMLVVEQNSNDKYQRGKG